MRTKIVVTGLIKNADNKYLISQRSDPKISEAHLKWDFVGGVIDFGETAQEALKREVMEETGLFVSVGEMIPYCFTKVWSHEDYKIHAIVLCYKCELIKGTLQLHDKKINQLKWIGKKEFKEYNFLPSIPLFLRAIGDFIQKNKKELLKTFKPNKDRLPSHQTIGRTLQNIDFDELNNTFHTWANMQVKITKNEWVSID